MTFTLKNLTLALAAAGTLLLTACGPTAQDDHHIKVGISAGIDQSLWAVVQKVAKQKYDLDVEVVTFNDYVLPNEALNNGDLDVNAFSTSRIWTSRCRSAATSWPRWATPSSTRSPAIRRR